MATYNGEKYIREQIDSLLRQTEQNFLLYVSDDGSTDSTYDILEEYAQQYPNKIFVGKNNGQHGAKHNFMHMMIAHKNDYIMLCDQDDVWLDNKIEVTLRAMKEQEKIHGAQTPLLIHTDLCVVDENLNIIDKSYRHMMNANYARTELKDQIIQNTLTGCTAMYNRALADLILKEPEFCVMHDWWLILVASALGKVHAIDRQTILYRQHGGNAVGVRKMHSPLYMLHEFLFNTRKIKVAIKETYPQAESFLDTFSDELNTTQKSFLQAYMAIPKYGKLRRIYESNRLHIKKNGFFRRIAQILFV